MTIDLSTSLPVVTVALEQTTYSVEETAGVVQVCVVLTGGIEINIPVTFTSREGSALGKFYLPFLLCQIYSNFKVNINVFVLSYGRLYEQHNDSHIFC